MPVANRWLNKTYLRLMACRFAELGARSTDVMQQAEIPSRIINKYFHATVQHFACCPKWNREVNASRGIC
jgi:hypothetical protein